MILSFSSFSSILRKIRKMFSANSPFVFPSNRLLNIFLIDPKKCFDNKRNNEKFMINFIDNEALKHK